MAPNGILILDLPPKTFVGINLTSFNSSPHFHGILNLPSGFHFLYTGTDASLSIRNGRWLNIPVQTQVGSYKVLRWNAEHEVLDLLDASSPEAESAIGSIGTLKGRGLVDYTALLDAASNLASSQEDSTTTHAEAPRDNENVWASLTSHISAATISRILRAPETPTSIETQQSWAISSISSAPQDAETIPGLNSDESNPVLQDAGASKLNFTAINLKQTWPDDSVGRDRTDKARDKSWYLGQLISTLIPTTTSSMQNVSANQRTQQGAKEVLAEVQFCFLMVLTLANYSALEQWKRILSVMLGCKSALRDIQAYFVEIVKVLRSQLGRVEDVEGGLFDLTDDISSQWLRTLLKGFRANVDELQDEQDAKNPLDKVLRELEEWLRQEYGWADDGAILKRGMIELEDGERVELQVDGLDEEEESGEYAPVIVEM